MTYDDPNNHAAFRESIATALAGGLSGAEQTAFDTHRAGCADCAAEFECARQSEDRMTALFAAALPAVGFEDRVVQRLRRESASPSRTFRLPRLNWIHPAVRHAATGVAAAIVLAGVGYAVSGILEPMPTQRRRDASNLRDVTRSVSPPASQPGTQHAIGQQRTLLDSERARKR